MQLVGMNIILLLKEFLLASQQLIIMQRQIKEKNLIFVDAVYIQLYAYIVFLSF